MSFVEWTFLFGAAAIAGPIIAHLLAKPRFRRIPFTMLKFLLSGQTQSQSRRRLRDLLILLLRCAIIVLIAMLFARPLLYIKSKPKAMRHTYYLGLDNSASMAYADEQGTYLDQMKDLAIGHIMSVEADAIFNICPLAAGTWRQSLTRQEALAEVKSLKIVPGSADVGVFLSGIKDSNSSRRSATQPDETESLNSKVSAVLVSDFTPKTLKQFLDVQNSTAVDFFDYRIVASSRPINNAAIVDAHTVNVTDNSLSINVTVANYGQTEQIRQLTAQIGMGKPASVDMELSPNQVIVYPVRLNMGFNRDRNTYLPVELSLSPGDGLKEDDKFYLAVRVPEQRNVNVFLAEANKDELFLLETAIQTLSEAGSSGVFNVRRILLDELNLSSFSGVDIVVFSGLTDNLGRASQAMESFIKNDGRVIFFLTGELSSGTANQLWQRGVLAALPIKCVREQTYVEVSPREMKFSGMDAVAARAMSNYRIDQVPLSGYWLCEQHQESRCLWRFQNGAGFVYFRQIGNGISILINTSADGSLGALTKSNVTVAFCRYFLGEDSRIRDYSFAGDERITLPVSDIDIDLSRQKQFWVQRCDGTQASLMDGGLLEPGGVGWVKSLSEPVIWAGVNLPIGETDMRRPIAEEVDNALKRVFSFREDGGTSSAETISDTQQKPVWQILVWAAIVLLLIESAVANRLKR